MSHTRRRDRDVTRSIASRRPGAGTLPWSVTNTLLVGFLILLAPDPWVTWLVGGSAIAVAAVTGAIVAVRRTAGIAPLTPLDVIAAWLPGLIALSLAGVGLALVIRNPDDEVLRLGGVGLFLVQILFIAITGSVPEPRADSADRRSVRQSA